MTRDALAILVVDDEPEVLDTVRRMLTRLGTETHGAGSTREALALLEDHSEIAVVLADVTMPGADGFALARAAQAGRTDLAALEIVFMTGLGTAEAAVEAIRSQAFDFVTKPFRAAAIAEAVSRALESAERRRAAARRLAAGDVARKRAEGARASLFSVISHELRTPLNPIIGLAHLIAEDETMPRERVRDHALCIHREGARLLGLIERSLTIVELDAGDPPRRRPGARLEPLIRAVAARADRAPDGKRAFIRVEAPAALEADCDEHLVSLALAELVANALQAAPAESEVRVEGAPNGAGARIAVSDAGPGYPDAVLAAGAPDFTQADMTETRAWRGAGLGLGLARRVAEAHGGRLILSNGASGGAVAALVW